MADDNEWTYEPPPQAQEAQTPASDDGWEYTPPPGSQPRPQELESSRLGSVARGAVEGGAALPGAVVGGMIGATIGAPLPVAGSVILGAAGAAAGGYLNAKLNDYLLRSTGFREGEGFLSDKQQQADVEQHPYYRAAGELGSAAVGFSPFRLAQSIMKSAEAAGKTMTMAEAMQAARATRMIGGGVMGGFEIGQNIVDGSDVDMTKLAMAVATGATFARPYKYTGAPLVRAGEKIGEYGQPYAQKLADKGKAWVNKENPADTQAAQPDPNAEAGNQDALWQHSVDTSTEAKTIPDPEVADVTTGASTPPKTSIGTSETPPPPRTPNTEIGMMDGERDGGNKGGYAKGATDQEGASVTVGNVSPDQVMALTNSHEEATIPAAAKPAEGAQTPPAPQPQVPPKSIVPPEVMAPIEKAAAAARAENATKPGSNQPAPRTKLKTGAPVDEQAARFQETASHIKNQQDIEALRGHIQKWAEAEPKKTANEMGSALGLTHDEVRMLRENNGVPDRLQSLVKGDVTATVTPKDVDRGPKYTGRDKLNRAMNKIAEKDPARANEAAQAIGKMAPGEKTALRDMTPRARLKRPTVEGTETQARTLTDASDKSALNNARKKVLESKSLLPKENETHAEAMARAEKINDMAVKETGKKDPAEYKPVKDFDSRRAHALVVEARKFIRAYKKAKSDVMREQLKSEFHEVEKAIRSGDQEYFSLIATNKGEQPVGRRNITVEQREQQVARQEQPVRESQHKEEITGAPHTVEDAEAMLKSAIANAQNIEDKARRGLVPKSKVAELRAKALAEVDQAMDRVETAKGDEQKLRTDQRTAEPPKEKALKRISLKADDKVNKRGTTPGKPADEGRVLSAEEKAKLLAERPDLADKLKKPPAFGKADKVKGKDDWARTDLPMERRASDLALKMEERVAPVTIDRNKKTLKAGKGIEIDYAHEVTGRDLMDFAQKHDSIKMSEDEKRIWSALNEHLGETQVFIVEDNPRMVGLTSGSSANGLYFHLSSDGKPVIVIQKVPEHQLVPLLLHEFGHRATIEALRYDPHAREFALTFMDDLRNALTKRGYDLKDDPSLSYGFTSPWEFLAEINSNAILREQMSSIPASNRVRELLDTPKASMWDTFVNWVRKLVGLPPTKDTITALDAALKWHEHTTAQTAHYEGENGFPSRDYTGPGAKPAEHPLKEYAKDAEESVRAVVKSSQSLMGRIADWSQRLVKTDPDKLSDHWSAKKLSEPTQLYARDTGDRLKQFDNVTSMVWTNLGKSLDSVPKEVMSDKKRLSNMFDKIERNEVSKMSAEDKKLYDETLKPVIDEGNKMFNLAYDLAPEWMKDTFGPPVKDHMMHILVEGNDARLMDIIKNEGEGSKMMQSGRSENPIQSGRNISKRPAGSQIKRKIWALEGTNGERTVIAENEDGLSMWRDKKMTKVNDPAFNFVEGKGWKDPSTGKAYTMRDVFASEVNKNMKDTQFITNPFLATHYALGELTRVVRNLHFLQTMKADPEFLKVATANPKDPRIAKLGWEKSRNPQFENYWMDKNMRRTMDDYHRPGFDTEGINFFRNFSRAVTNLLFWLPVVHVMNVGGHWFVARGGDWATPEGWGRLAKSGPAAFHEVMTNGPAMQEALQNGASLISRDVLNGKPLQMLAQKAGEAIQSKPSKWDPVAKVFNMSTMDLGKAIYKASSVALWGANDMFYMQLYMEARAKGMAPSKAVTHVERHFPNYRIPTTAITSGEGGRAISQFLSDPATQAFGRYHFGWWNSWAHISKDLAHGNADQRKEALGNLAAAVVLGFVLYPALDEVWKGVTGDENASARRRGPTSIPSNLWKDGPVGALRSSFTVPPLASTAMETIANKDWAGRNIYEPGDWAEGNYGRVAGQLAEHTARGLVAPYGQFAQGAQQGNSGLQTLRNQVLDIKQKSPGAQKYEDKTQHQQAKSRAKNPRGFLENPFGD